MTSDPTSPKNHFHSEPHSIERDIRTLVQQSYSRAQSVAPRSHAGFTPIDPKKWNLDENTGEYLRITYHGGNRVLVDPTPYGERWKESVLAGQELLRKVGWAFVYLVTGGVLWVIATNSKKPDCVLPGALGITFLLSSAWVFFLAAIDVVREAARDLGPEPVSQRPRREQAEKQRVHGAGRFLNREEIDRAASGETVFLAGEQQYED